MWEYNLITNNNNHMICIFLSKILNLHHKQQNCYNSNISCTPKEVVHSFSSYVLSQEEQHALSYGLKHHTLSKVKRNTQLKVSTKVFY